MVYKPGAGIVLPHSVSSIRLLLQKDIKVIGMALMQKFACSLSIVAGGQILITADNLAQPGYFRVYFYNVKTSLAGEAVLKDSAQIQSCSPGG